MSEIKIPLLDLKTQYRNMADQIKDRIMSVVESQRYIMGPEVSELENNIADYCGVPHAIGVASGTDALLLALKSFGIKEGDEVITTPFTFYSTASSIVHAGGRPVFADIDPDTCLVRPELIQAAITDRTRAIIPVHLFGQCADMDAINGLAKDRDIFVLEDACQAIGAKLSGRAAGSMGDAGALSFYPSKNLGAMGDGGMVLTTRDDIAEKMKVLRVHGASKEYHHEVIGYNSRLDTIQAAVLLAKFPHLDDWADKRAAHAKIYNQRFEKGPVKPLDTVSGARHVYNNYVVRAPKRDKLMEYLKGRGIGCAVYYPEPLHKMACFSQFMSDEEFPGAETAAAECLAIPAYPEMTDDMVEEVASAVLGFYGS